MRKLLLVLLLLIGMARPSFAQISFVGAADVGDNGGATSGITKSYTCGSGSNRLLVLVFLGDIVGGNDDITGVTYAGTTMTLVQKNSGALTSRIMYQYYLLNPASGANNIVITSGTTKYLILVAADYAGVAGGLDNKTTNVTAAPTTTTLTTSLTTIANNSWVVLGESSQAASGVPAAGAGATIRTYGANYGEPALFDSNGAVTPAGSYSMTTTRASSLQYIAHSAASFSPSAGGAVPCRRMLLGVGGC